MKGANSPGPSRGLIRTHQAREKAVAALLVGPSSLGFLVFVLAPIVALFVFSLADWNLIRDEFEFIGLENYTVNIPGDPRLPAIGFATFGFTVGYVALTVVGGLVLAVSLNKRLRALPLYRAVFFLPVVISLAAWTLSWRLMLQPNGAVNQFLGLFGIDPIPWFQDPKWALAAVVFVAFTKSLGFAMVLFLVGLQAVPNELAEAARIDGASEYRVFRHVTLPMIAPFTLLVIVLLTINSFRSFALIFLMTGGGPGDGTRVLSFYIYEQGLRFFEMGYASALAVILFIGVLALTVAQFTARRRWVHHEQ